MQEEEFYTPGSNSPQKEKFWKFLTVMAIVGIGLILVFVKLFYLQVIKADDYRKKAKRQHESRVELSAERGFIYDRQGVLLASNVRSISVAADPRILNQKEDRKKRWKLVAELSKISGKSKEYYLKKIKRSKKAFVWLERGLPGNTIEILEEIDSRGIILIEEPRRNYHYGEVGAQLLGYTDIDNIGISGIEKSCDTTLKGRSGYMIMYRDALGRLRPSAELPVIPARHGSNLHLTIDFNLQRIMEYELSEGFKKYDAEAAIGIAIEPSTGKILAIASTPGFNPNTYSKNQSGVMRNRGITDTYEPGSTFKLVTAAAAMQEKIVRQGQIFNAYNGLLKFKEYSIRDDHPMSYLTFEDAMIHSSNIVMAEIANSIPAHTFYKYIRDFGFGLKHDVDIPGEVSGSVRKPAKWYPSTKRFIGHGYGISATALQILNSYATIANGGEMMKPYVIEKITDSDGETITQINPEKVRRVVSEKTSNALLKILTDVVNEGTGKNAIINGVPIAGKTGTAQQLTDGSYTRKNYTASFVGIFPADNPKIAMIVLLDKPRANYYGGSSAAPIFRNITMRWIAVAPEFAGNAFQSDQAKTDTIRTPDLRGLKYSVAENLLDETGLKITPKQSPESLILYQMPAPDEILTKGRSVSVRILKFKTDSVSGKNIPAIEKPGLKGLSLRRAIQILTECGIKYSVSGKGFVRKQVWKTDKDGTKHCRIICRM